MNQTRFLTALDKIAELLYTGNTALEAKWKLLYLEMERRAKEARHSAAPARGVSRHTRNLLTWNQLKFMRHNDFLKDEDLSTLLTQDSK